MARDEELTSAEIETLQLLAEGYSHQEVADKLFIVKHTLFHRLRSVRVKLNARNTVNAVAIGLHKGIISIEHLDES